MRRAFLCLFVALSRVAAQDKPNSNNPGFFIQPPGDSSKPDPKDNVQWTLGEDHDVSWGSPNVIIDSYNITLNNRREDLIGDGPEKVLVYTQKDTSGTSFTWNVSVDGFKGGVISPMFYFYLQATDGAPAYLVSHDFNITGLTISTSSSAAASSTPTSNTPQYTASDASPASTSTQAANNSNSILSPALKLSLGLGIGLGGAVLLLLGILAGLYIQKKHRKGPRSPTEASRIEDSKQTMGIQDAAPHYEVGELPEHVRIVELPGAAPSAPIAPGTPHELH